MGRREQRAALEATWTVYEPTEGKPITKADRENAVTREEYIDAKRREQDAEIAQLRRGRR